jgi:hypothetical protein
MRCGELALAPATGGSGIGGRGGRAVATTRARWKWRWGRGRTRAPLLPPGLPRQLTERGALREGKSLRRHAHGRATCVGEQGEGCRLALLLLAAGRQQPRGLLPMPLRRLLWPARHWPLPRGLR